MVREDLISSAINFLQDPSVAASPIEKRKAFLQSKNLTEEEIEIALSRAGDDFSNPSQNQQYGSQANYAYSSTQNSRQSPPAIHGYGYGPYQGGPWTQPPPESPQRDWRDWFIMATVTGGVSYGLYTIAKRYVLPLIAPPTPPQLEQDKASIDESFTRAFALIDQVATDTAALKTAESERTEKLDNALHEVESVISELKAANKRREDDSRRIGDEVRGLKEMIPKALEGWKSEEDVKLKELGAGLKSLKILVGNRVGDQAAPNPTGKSSYNHANQANQGLSDRSRESNSSTPTYNPSGYSYSGTTDKQEDTLPTSGSSNGTAPAPGINTPKSPMIFDGRPASRAAIPAWQMAASSGHKGKSTKIPEPAKVDGSAEGSEASVDV